MAKGRWNVADDNFRQQIDVFMARTKMSREEIADYCGVCRATFDNYYNHPSTLRKRVERSLMMLFEEYDQCYDPTMGEGATA